jgi:putative hydrolase of the HAD superfamily
MPYFGGMAFSDEVGVSKPQAAMYEEAARQLGVKPCELLHLGDLERTDVTGAKAVGAKAALFTGALSVTNGAPLTQADYVFASWGDFIEALPDVVNQG